MKLTLVIEGVKGSEMVQKVIRWMRYRKLDDIVCDPEIQREYQPLYQPPSAAIDIIGKEAV